MQPCAPLWLHILEYEPRTGVRDTGDHMQTREEGRGSSFEQGQDLIGLSQVGICRDKATP